MTCCRRIEEQLGLSRNRIRVSFQIETGWGVLNLPKLAIAGRDRLAGIILGTVDLSADLGLPEVRYFRHPICEWARMIIVSVAGAVGVPAIELDDPGLPRRPRQPDLRGEPHARPRSHGGEL